jgi:hypothetical protein
VGVGQHIDGIRPKILEVPIANQNPEQIAPDKIDAALEQYGWIVQDKDRMNLHVGPADYILFFHRTPVGYRHVSRADTSSPEQK